MVTGFFVGLMLLIVFIVKWNSEVTFGDFIFMCGGGAAIGWLLQFEVIRWLGAAALMVMVPAALWGAFSGWLDNRRREK